MIIYFILSAFNNFVTIFDKVCFNENDAHVHSFSQLYFTLKNLKIFYSSIFLQLENNEHTVKPVYNKELCHKNIIYTLKDFLLILIHLL